MWRLEAALPGKGLLRMGMLLWKWGRPKALHPGEIITQAEPRTKGVLLLLLGEIRGASTSLGKLLVLRRLQMQGFVLRPIGWDWFFIVMKCVSSDPVSVEYKCSLTQK